MIRRVVSVVLVAAIIAGCGTSAPTAPPSPAATRVPAATKATLAPDALVRAFLTRLHDRRASFLARMSGSVRAGALAVTMSGLIVLDGDDLDQQMRIEFLDGSATASHIIVLGGVDYSSYDGGPWRTDDPVIRFGDRPFAELDLGDLVYGGERGFRGRTLDVVKNARDLPYAPAALGLFGVEGPVTVTRFEAVVEADGTPLSITFDLVVGASPDQPEVTGNITYDFTTYGEAVEITAPEVFPIVRIVWSFPLGWDDADVASLPRAIALAIDRRDGRVGGYAIEYLSYDDSFDEDHPTDGAVEIARESVADPSVVAIIGPLDSGAARLEIPIACRGGLAIVSPGARATGLTRPVVGDDDQPGMHYPGCDPTFFRVVAPLDLEGAVAVDWIARNGSLPADPRPWIVHDESPESGSAMAAAIAWAEKRGIAVVGTSRLPAGEKAIAELAAKIHAAGARDIVHIGRLDRAAGVLWRAIRDHAPGVDFVATDPWPTDAFLDAAGTAADGAHVLSSEPDPYQADAAGIRFIDDYEALYGEIGVHTAVAYDAANLVLDAIERAAALAPAGDVRALRRLVLEEMRATSRAVTSQGLVTFDASGDALPRRFSEYVITDGEVYRRGFFLLP